MKEGEDEEVDLEFEKFCAKVFMDGYKNALVNIIEGANAMMKDISIEKIERIVKMREENERARTH